MHWCPSRALTRSLPVVLWLGTAACGGGGGAPLSDPGNPGGGGPPGNPATSLAPKASFTDADLRHFLARTHFGVRASELAQVELMGLPAYVAQMLQFPPVGSTAVELAADVLLVNPTDPPGLEGGFPTEGQLVRWWAYLMQRTALPFQEVVAMFWHDHFAASNVNLEPEELWWTKGHVNLWRGAGAGNLKDLCVTMARDALMLNWLDGTLNTFQAPNENYGREWWELFTLGADNGYVQADIVEGARAWTGWRRRLNAATGQQEVQFDPARHDPGNKTIFGVLIPGQNRNDDFQAMVDITFAERPVEDLIARKILAAFCYDAPPQTVVDQLGALLRQANWELAPVFATLFLSEAFYSPEAKAGFVKSPVDYVFGFSRGTGILAPERQVLNDGLQILGQVPTQPPSVNGWPVGEAWLSAQGMVDRANTMNTIVTRRVFQQQEGIDLSDLLPPAPMTTAQVVGQLASTLNLTLSPTESAAYVTYLDTTATGAASPFNPADPTHIDLRFRGLIYILTQHPLYTVR